jgi:hypothetical protein
MRFVIFILFTVLGVSLQGETLKPIEDTHTVLSFEELGIASGTVLELNHHHLGGTLTVVAGPADQIGLTLDDFEDTDSTVFLRYDGEKGSISLILGGDQREDDLIWQLPEGTALKLHNVDGDIQVDGISGPVEVSTADGDIGMIGVGGPTIAEVFDGDITVELREDRADEDLFLSAVDGDVILRSPSPLNAEFRASTIDGDISCNQKLSNVTFKNDAWGSEGETLGGTLGKGGPKLRLNVVDGDIDIIVGPTD